MKQRSVATPIRTRDARPCREGAHRSSLLCAGRTAQPASEGTHAHPSSRRQPPSSALDPSRSIEKLFGAQHSARTQATRHPVPANIQLQLEHRMARRMRMNDWRAQDASAGSGSFSFNCTEQLPSSNNDKSSSTLLSVFTPAASPSCSWWRLAFSCSSVVVARGLQLPTRRLPASNSKLSHKPYEPSDSVAVVASRR